ncbi:hypothetical protein [Caproicibacter sp.]|uniref:hypothetical protein n=1 Tax=Caproicibacter sp. TaxID=2814884 RepID=UPI00398A3AB7
MQPKHMRGKSAGSRVLTGALSVLVVLLGALCILSWMILNDPNAGTSMPQPSDAAVSKVISASVAGKEVSLTPEEVSGWLNFLIQKDKNAQSGSVFTAVSVTAGEDGTAEVYAPVRYGGKTFGVLMNVSPSFDQASEQMKFAVNSVRVGRLPVPVGFAMDYLEKGLPSLLARKDNTLACNTASLFRVDYSGASAQLRMTQMKLLNQLFVLQFTIQLGLTG